ncbi:MAG: hypothetical protein J6X07_06750 [Prevotella sp.]|nr:hypothetical protein [Prevotella sp.]
MTKDDKKRYDRMINDIASRLMIDAHKEAFEVTENVFRDILTALHEKIEQYFKEHQRPTV